MRGLGLMVHHSIILCLNLFESSYCRDFGAQGKNHYVEALLENIDWDVCQLRYDRAREGLLPPRPYDHLQTILKLIGIILNFDKSIRLKRIVVNSCCVNF